MKTFSAGETVWTVKGIISVQMDTIKSVKKEGDKIKYFMNGGCSFYDGEVFKTKEEAFKCLALNTKKYFQKHDYVVLCV